jgi:hypothetical protein
MNAKKELLEIIKETSKLKCAIIILGEYSIKKEIILKVGYSKYEYDKFLKQLDFSYDSGFGTQELFGTLWLEDGSWCVRGEYDGSEWWQNERYPPIPLILNNPQRNSWIEELKKNGLFIK